MELEFATDAVPGFPAYTLPACPALLNGDPGAEAALPGVGPLPVPPHEWPAFEPFWPVVGVCWGEVVGPPGRAKAVPAAASKTQLAIVKDAMMCVIVILLV